MEICSDGQHGAYAFWDRFHDSSGNLIPDIASGYFSDKFPYPGSLTPLTVRNLWSGACNCGNDGSYYTPQGCHENYKEKRKEFCENLYDAGGNKVTNPPPICGGTGPEVFNYNPVQAALGDAQNEAAELIDKYDATSTVKKIVGVGFVVSVLIVLLYLIYKF